MTQGLISYFTVSPHGHWAKRPRATGERHSEPDRQRETDAATPEVAILNDLLKDFHPTNSFEEGLKQTPKPTPARTIATPPGAITIEAYCAKTGLSLRAARYHIAR